MENTLTIVSLKRTKRKRVKEQTQQRIMNTHRAPNHTFNRIELLTHREPNIFIRRLILCCTCACCCCCFVVLFGLVFSLLFFFRFAFVLGDYACVSRVASHVHLHLWNRISWFYTIFANLFQERMCQYTRARTAIQPRTKERWANTAEKNTTEYNINRILNFLW